ncbi:hypothetical protein WT40_01900 [Burkholderia territorii]|nr:hypothetical protein WT40_01900 [Burkholderia territorii]
MRRGDSPASAAVLAAAPVPGAACSAVLLDDATRLPRARSSSDAATHAPNASFQIDLNDLFILFSLGSRMLNHASANATANEARIHARARHVAPLRCLTSDD